MADWSAQMSRPEKPTAYGGSTGGDNTLIPSFT